MLEEKTFNICCRISQEASQKVFRVIFLTFICLSTFGMLFFVRQGHAADWEYILYDGEHLPEIARFSPFNDEYLLVRQSNEAANRPRSRKICRHNSYDYPMIFEKGGVRRIDEDIRLGVDSEHYDASNPYECIVISEKGAVRRIYENLWLGLDNGYWSGKKSILVYYGFPHDGGTYTSFILYDSNLKEITRLPLNATESYSRDDCLFITPKDGSAPFYMLAYIDGWPFELVPKRQEEQGVPFLMGLSEDGKILWKIPRLNADGSPLIYKNMSSAREGVYVHAQDVAGSYIFELSYTGEIKKRVPLPKECASDKPVNLVGEPEEMEEYEFASAYMDEVYFCKINKENGSIAFSKVPAKDALHPWDMFPLATGEFIAYSWAKRKLFFLDKNYQLQGRYEEAQVQTLLPTSDRSGLIIVASRKPDPQNQKRVQLFISRISQKDFKSVTN